MARFLDCLCLDVEIFVPSIKYKIHTPPSRLHHAQTYVLDSFVRPRRSLGCSERRTLSRLPSCNPSLTHGKEARRNSAKSAFSSFLVCITHFVRRREIPADLDLAIFFVGQRATRDEASSLSINRKCPACSTPLSLLTPRLSPAPRPLSGLKAQTLPEYTVDPHLFQLSNSILQDSLCALFDGSLHAVLFKVCPQRRSLSPNLRWLLQLHLQSC